MDRWEALGVVQMSKRREKYPWGTTLSKAGGASAPPPPPPVSASDLYRWDIPVTLSIGLVRGAVIPSSVWDELNSNHIVQTGPHLHVLLLHLTRVIPHCVEEDERHLPVVIFIFVFGDGIIDFSLWFPSCWDLILHPLQYWFFSPVAFPPFSPPPLYLLSALPGDHVSLWWEHQYLVPPGVIDEAHDDGVDLVPDPPTDYHNQVEVISFCNLVAVLLCFAGIPTPLLASSPPTAHNANLNQWDTAVFHPPLVRVSKARETNLVSWFYMGSGLISKTVRC